MIISFEKPPIYDEAVKKFQLPPDRGTFFTYGNTCYSPSGEPIPDYLAPHEGKHSEQQKENDKDAAIWWRKYFDDPEFRLSQEVEAYGEQYKYLCRRVKDRNQRARILYEIAGQLSSGLYAHCTTRQDALQLIRKYCQI